MTDDKYLNEINTLLSSIIHNDDLELSFADSAETVEGWDSLAHIHLILGIEKKFDIKFSITDTMGLQNISELIELIKSKV